MFTSNPVPRIAALLVLLSCVSVATARAQIWQGPAALEIKAEGKGASVAGGTVELVYLALEPPAGPPPVVLDANGRAVIGGLAEGRWRVSVLREGFMTYQAEIDVRRDEKPGLGATFQQNVPGAVHMMRVKISRAKPSGPAVPPPQQIAERPAPQPRPAAPPAAPAPPAPPAESAPMSHATPQPQPPAPQTPPPAVERPAPPPAPAPTPTPTPTPAPVEPTPEPEPPAAAVSQGSVLHRSYADRTCYECKPGEASLSVERVVAAGVGCGPGLRDLMAQSGDAASLPEGCAVLRLALPAGGRYTGYRYEIQERSGSVDCLAGRDCPGGGRWPADPSLARSTAGTTVSAAFENVGVGAERRAILTVYYTGH